MPERKPVYFALHDRHMPQLPLGYTPFGSVEMLDQIRYSGVGVTFDQLWITGQYNLVNGLVVLTRDQKVAVSAEHIPGSLNKDAVSGFDAIFARVHFAPAAVYNSFANGFGAALARYGLYGYDYHLKNCGFFIDQRDTEPFKNIGLVYRAELRHHVEPTFPEHESNRELLWLEKNDITPEFLPFLDHHSGIILPELEQTGQLHQNIKPPAPAKPAGVMVKVQRGIQ